MTVSTDTRLIQPDGTNSLWPLLFVVAVSGLVCVAFFDALRSLVNVWNTHEEYSFGFMVPLVSAYLIWQRRAMLPLRRVRGSWLGVMLVVLALTLLAIGRIGTITTISQYAFLLAILGLFLAFVGHRAFLALAMPLGVLVFMVPLPARLVQELSLTMQLWSSQIGVALLRLFDVSVYLEGNVIDLGSLKLQVVEACSGLRYLFPLVTLAFIAVCLFRAAAWKRMVVVVSAIPITVIMNSVRIAMVGLLSERFGKSMAEGFLHDFEGWVVFMVCTGILFAEMAILVRIGPDKSSLRDAFYFAPAEGAAAPGHGHAAPGAFAVPTTFVVAGALVAIALALSLTLPARESVVPVRAAFAEFPMEIGDWRGRPDRLEADTLNVLKLHDYLLADYVGSDPRGRVNLHVAYYASQIDGAWMHSPQGCIPADGWEIIDLQRHRMNSVTFAGDPMVVNRVSIRKGNVRQIVYYWFQERGRITTDEHFSEKLYVLLDAVRRNRTDGAMVRLVTNAIPGESDESADRRLEQFAALFVPQLTPHIPG